MHYSDSEIPYAPILRPTPKEFQNFQQYVYKLFSNPKFANAGCVKIIPPYLPQSNTIDSKTFIKNNQVKSPLLQELNGTKCKLISA